jgi:poly(A)-specific ribonuclease
MTAELFVKLTAKLYTAHIPSSNTNSPPRGSTGPAYRPSSSTSSSDSDSDSSPSGGALLNPTSSNGKSHPNSNPFSLLAMDDNLPPAYHASCLNPTAVLHPLNDEEAATLAKEPQPRQWIPDLTNAFWDIYVNKLRVNAVEGGVCDLEEGGED